MNRRAFTEVCTICMTGGVLGPILSSCSPVYYTTGALANGGITVQRSEFIDRKKNTESIRPYLLVTHESLEFPIYVFRFSATKYSAVLMKCTHQGTELLASGDHLYCPAHGSEFNNAGVVAQGPAEKDLRSFPVTIEGDQLIIDLRS